MFRKPAHYSEASKSIPIHRFASQCICAASGPSAGRVKGCRVNHTLQLLTWVQPTPVHACKSVCAISVVYKLRLVGSEQRSQGASRLVGTRVLQKALGGVGWAASVRSLVRFFIHDCAASSSSLGSEGRSMKAAAERNACLAAGGGLERGVLLG